MNESQKAFKALPERRTVLKGAAWSVPVVAAAVMAPLAAASTIDPVQCAADGAFTKAGKLSTTITAGNAPTNIGTGQNGELQHSSVFGDVFDITVAATFLYSGSGPLELGGLELGLNGTTSLDWEIIGSPVISSSQGGISLGGFDNNGRRSASSNPGWLGYATVSGAEPLESGQSLTVQYVLRAHGPAWDFPRTGVDNPDATGFAYGQVALFSCGRQIVATGYPDADKTFNFVKAL